MINFAIYLTSKLVTSLTGVLPHSAARRFGWSLGYYASFISRRRMLNAQRHMGRILGPDADLQRAAREVFCHYGRYWTELLWIQSHGPDTRATPTTVEGLERIGNAKAAGKGMILAVPHLGVWEMLGSVTRQEQIPLTAVVELLPHHLMINWFTELRRRLGIELQLAGDHGVSTWALAKKLRAGGAVALLCDRDITGTGVPVLFFGEETTLPAGAATLAELTGAPIFPAAVYFQPGGGHRVVIHPPLEPTTSGSLEQRLRLRTQRLAQALEVLIRDAPTQWHLVRPNWPSDR